MSDEELLITFGNAILTFFDHPNIFQLADDVELKVFGKTACCNRDALVQTVEKWDIEIHRGTVWCYKTIRHGHVMMCAAKIDGSEKHITINFVGADNGTVVINLILVDSITYKK